MGEIKVEYIKTKQKGGGQKRPQQLSAPANISLVIKSNQNFQRLLSVQKIRLK